MSIADAVGAVGRAVEAIATAAERDPAVFRSRAIRRAAARMVASIVLADDVDGPRRTAAHARRLAGAVSELAALDADPREVARSVGAAMLGAGTREGVADGQRLLTWAAS